MSSLVIIACPMFVAVVGLTGRLDAITAVVLTAVFTVGALFVVWGNWWIYRNIAEHVVTDERGIEAKTFDGRSIRVDWGDIAVRDEYDRRDVFRGTFRQVRLVSRDGSRMILDGELPNFAQLLDDLRLMTPGASRGRERRWWERVLSPG